MLVQSEIIAHMRWIQSRRFRIESFFRRNPIFHLTACLTSDRHKRIEYYDHLTGKLLVGLCMGWVCGRNPTSATAASQKSRIVICHATAERRPIADHVMASLKTLYNNIENTLSGACRSISGGYKSLWLWQQPNPQSIGPYSFFLKVTVAFLQVWSSVCIY